MVNTAAKACSKFRIPKLLVLAVLILAAAKHRKSATQSAARRASRGLSPYHPTLAHQGIREPAAETLPDFSQPPQQPILYHHFHKAGGTEVCRTMRRSQLQTTQANWTGLRNKDDLNCNAVGYGPHTDPRKNNASVAITCKGLTPYTVNQGIPFTRNNFVAMEIPIDQAVPCSGFRNFALMRHPVTRFLSHMKVHRWTETLIREAVYEHERLWNITGTRDQGKGRDFSPEAKKARRIARRQGQAKPFVGRLYPSTNNLVIRQLLGLGRNADDCRAINEQDLEQAKRIVDQFDAIVPLERQHEPAVQALLERVVPEYCDASRQHAGHDSAARLKAARRTKNKRDTYHPSAEFVAFVREQNKFDLRLYEYVHEKLGLFFKDTVATSQKYQRTKHWPI